MSKLVLDVSTTLEWLSEEGVTALEIMRRAGCSRNTVVNFMKRHQVATPKGFFCIPGRKVGYPKGRPMSEEQKALRSKMFSGARNPFAGRKHSAATRRKMSENHADIRGDRNPFRRSLAKPGNRAAHRVRCREVWAGRDAKYRERFGSRISKALATSDAFRSTRFHKNHRCGWHRSRKAGIVFFRSSWEQRLCVVLDQDPKVTAYALEPYAVRYLDEKGVERQTRLDFLILFGDGSREVVEVKPANLRKGRTAFKIAGLAAHCEARGLSFQVMGLSEIEAYENRVRGLL